MPTPSVHPAVRHLQITFTPDEYQRIVDKARRGRVFVKMFAGEEYRKRLPRYVVARCPLCGVPYIEPLDTHGLEGWTTHPDKSDCVFTVLKSDERYSRCDHFVAVQTFINLNGLLPVEISYFDNGLPDIPFVMQVFLPDDLPAFGVFHSLPICRIENNQFVPRYTVYMVTYYAANPSVMWDRQRAEQDAYFGKDNTEDWRGELAVASGREGSNFQLWIQRGKLQWLDPAAPDLPLKAGPLEEFPYVNIQGYGRRFVFRQGEIRLLS